MLVETSDVTQACKFLMYNKILVRQMRPPIDHTFRMSLRTMQEMQCFMDVFTRYLNSLEENGKVVG